MSPFPTALAAVVSGPEPSWQLDGKHLLAPLSGAAKSAPCVTVCDCFSGQSASRKGGRKLVKAVGFQFIGAFSGVQRRHHNHKTNEI
jgi:hypothetical protein